MTPDTASDPQGQDPSNKRVRIDPNVTIPNSTAEPVSTNQSSPLQLAETLIEANVETLHPEQATLTKTFSKAHLRLLSKRHKKELSITKMDRDDEYIPRSANIKF